MRLANVSGSERDPVAENATTNERVRIYDHLTRCSALCRLVGLGTVRARILFGELEETSNRSFDYQASC